MVDVFAVGWDGIGHGESGRVGNSTFSKEPARPTERLDVSVRCTGGPPYWIFVYDDVHLTVQ